MNRTIEFFYTMNPVDYFWATSLLIFAITLCILLCLAIKKRTVIMKKSCKVPSREYVSCRIKVNIVFQQQFDEIKRLGKTLLNENKSTKIATGSGEVIESLLDKSLSRIDQSLEASVKKEVKF